MTLTDDGERNALITRAMEVAAAAARAGAAEVRGARRAQVDVRRKGVNDLTTSTDASSHAAIVAVITDAFPDHAVVGEDGSSGHGQLRWYVDALDGTVNYAHRIPCYAVSVALWDGPTPLVGAVIDATQDELYLAGRGRGATRDGETITVADTDDLTAGLVVTQSASRSPSGIAAFTDLLARLMAATGGVRMPGSRAIALCHVADGRYLGGAERSLDPWDLAAARVIIEEAGGRVTGFDGEPALAAGADDRIDVVASNGRVHDTLRALAAGTPPPDAEHQTPAHRTSEDAPR